MVFRHAAVGWEGLCCDFCLNDSALFQVIGEHKNLLRRLIKATGSN